ncbi:MAG: putative tyrosine recombinase [Phycisphaerales bacterium]|nr:putative tyrosine recombinase [Phycisphaerales bacterium]
MLKSLKTHTLGKIKVFDCIADVGARRHLAASTIECYQRWVTQFLKFCRIGGRWRHPVELGAAEVGAFLTDLARRRRLSASSQNQACNAIVFLYKQVLADEVPEGHFGKYEAERSKRPAQLPTVLSVAEVSALIDAIRRVACPPAAMPTPSGGLRTSGVARAWARGR